MKYYNILIFVAFGILTFSCANKNEVQPEANPSAQGQFTDTRNNITYKWVRYGNLDWMTDNLQYNTGNLTNCTAYQTYGWQNGSEITFENVSNNGYLYTLEGARQAVPDGWRLPTDEDWQALETSLGMPQDQIKNKGWRGANTGDIMRQSTSGSQLNMTLSGYFTPYTIMGTIGYRFMGVYGFYWTETEDHSKLGNYYFYRKVFYNSSQVYRESTEPDKSMLSLRLVRDAVVD